MPLRMPLRMLLRMSLRISLLITNFIQPRFPWSEHYPLRNQLFF